MQSDADARTRLLDDSPRIAPSEYSADREMIDINEIGATAFVIASIRALEDEKPEPLFSDPYAEWFSNEMVESVRDLSEP